MKHKTKTTSQQRKERRWRKRMAQARQVEIDFHDMCNKLAQGEQVPSFYTTTVLLPEE